MTDLREARFSRRDLFRLTAVAGSAGVITAVIDPRRFLFPEPASIPDFWEHLSDGIKQIIESSPREMSGDIGDFLQHPPLRTSLNRFIHTEGILGRRLTNFKVAPPLYGKNLYSVFSLSKGEEEQTYIAAKDGTVYSLPPIYKLWDKDTIMTPQTILAGVDNRKDIPVINPVINNVPITLSKRGSLSSSAEITETTKIYYSFLPLIEAKSSGVEPTPTPEPYPTEPLPSFHTWTGPMTFDYDYNHDWSAGPWTGYINNGGGEGFLYYGDPNINPAKAFRVLEYRTEGNEFRNYNIKMGEPWGYPVDWGVEVLIKILPPMMPTKDGEVLSLVSALRPYGGQHVAIAGIDMGWTRIPRISIKDLEGNEILKCRAPYQLVPNVDFRLGLYTVSRQIARNPDLFEGYIFMRVNNQLWVGPQTNPPPKLPEGNVGITPSLIHAEQYGRGFQPSNEIGLLNGQEKISFSRIRLLS